MTSTKTPRLDLTKESDDEYIDQYPNNWPILDWRAGELVIADGTTPADSALFDGLVVREATNGKSWIATKQPNGTYTKKWLTYPWQVCGSNSVAVGTAAPGTYTTYGLPTFNAPFAVNSSAADINGSQQIVLPIPGIYSLHLSARWTDADTSDSQRWAHIRINNNNTRSLWNEDGQHTNGNVVDCICTQQLTITQSLPIDVRLWQNSGSTKNVVLNLIAELVCPA
jgi:hypothetical protein